MSIGPKDHREPERGNKLITNYLRDWYGMQAPTGDMMSESMMRGMDMPMMHGTDADIDFSHFV